MLRLPIQDRIAFTPPYLQHLHPFLPHIPSVFYDTQDWCVAAAAGSAVPEVHLVWCCRSMAEMELVGEAIPSMLASVGTKKESHFTLSLYCTSKVRTSNDRDRHEVLSPPVQDTRCGSNIVLLCMLHFVC